MQDPGSGVGTALHKIESGVLGKPGAGNFGATYSFNMTAGAISTFTGYINGTIGSIDAEPLPGATLFGVFTDSSGDDFSTFRGDSDEDLTPTLGGLTVWVDSTEYPFDVDWQYDGIFTYGTWTTGGPTFVDTVSYFIEIK